ncbi:hypothetical protein BpHYR1_025391 [Brachionus plicatilis]|uniref:Uncharacterized protein n=1 Tax=Brachionus plicatilis TaxID=10195 RepID=A0A3M7RGR3_BRAPC|nr:hypothetical protein BpHYR1_025391 [Brachionus plicatilis]
MLKPVKKVNYSKSLDMIQKMILIFSKGKTINLILRERKDIFANKLNKYECKIMSRVEKKNNNKIHIDYLFDLILIWRKKDKIKFYMIYLLRLNFKPGYDPKDGVAEND